MTIVNQTERENYNIDKACRLIDYHLKLAALKSRPVKDVSSYENVIWLNDIPHCTGCYSRTWGPDNSLEDDTWIEVTSRKEPELPPVPDECRSWISDKSLYQKNDIPMLLNEITIVSDNETNIDIDHDQDRPITLKLSEHPDIQRVWEKYIDKYWLPWSEAHKEWETIIRVYRQMFEIHQAQIKMSEEYELVLGIGLLAWKPNNTSAQIIRHVFTVNVQLEFNPRQGRFIIIPSLDDDIIKAEYDMIDPEDMPIDLVNNVKISLAGLQDDFWDVVVISDSLRTFVHTLDPQGESSSQMSYDGQPKAKPVITYAPALILRKRSTSGLCNILNVMKQRIVETRIIPPELQDLCEIDKDSWKNINGEPILNVHQDDETDPEIYFPKPANEEQRAIVEKINNNGGVLVQGPPGTGKSHTIANLVSHLLATGKRVLITAKTPRALEVLESLIPPELRSLCISLLGTGAKEKQSMETSVNGILAQQEQFNFEYSDQTIKKLHSKLDELRKELAAIGNQIKQIRTSETESIEIIDGAYKGSAAKIAQKIAEQESQYDWLIDEVAIDSNCPVDGDKIVSLMKAKQTITEDDYHEIETWFPEHIPSPDDLSNLFDNEASAMQNQRTFEHIVKQDSINFYRAIDTNTLSQMQLLIKNVHQTLSQLVRNPSNWLQEAVQNVARGQIATYEKRKIETEKILLNINPYFEAVGNKSIHIPPSADYSELYNNLQVVINYFEAHNGSMNRIFLPSHIRKARSYIKKAGLKTKNEPMIDIEQLKGLLWYTYIILELNRARSYWLNMFELSNTTPDIQMTELNTACQQVELISEYYENITNLNQLYIQYAQINHPDWLSLNEIECERNKIDYVLSCQALIVMQKTIDRYYQDVSCHTQSEICHSVSRKIADAIMKRDISNYRLLYHEWERVTSKRTKIHSIDNEFNDAFQKLPLLKKRIQDELHDETWISKLGDIENAWTWKKAKRYLTENLRKDLIPDLTARTKQIEDEINITIEKLATQKAWTICCSRLNEDHRRHMVSWQKRMSRLGKGTSKYIIERRKEVQYHLSKCREAIPAWIMPLHRVWDTVNPAPSFFDVVIVDEASQCGFEAMPLFYLAKKIIIVGDDRQISPEEGFVSGEAVIQYKREFLRDFEFASSFGVESSLFDQAKLRYGTNRVTLREHFRCMPEIIRFSNEISYPDTPLIPLRQYGNNRLEPLKSIYVSEGYQEGSNSRIINRPEANTIVALIKEMCDDEQYKNRTIGVVILQGEAQGKLIEAELLKTIGAEEIKKRRIVCGNPYSFQGDERDVIILSMVIDAESRTRSLTTEAYKRRFNVAASRARDQMILVHSVTVSDLGPMCLRRKLLEFFQSSRQGYGNGGIIKSQMQLEALIKAAREANRNIAKPPNPFDSWFEVDVYIQIASRGYYICPQYEVAGKYIDIVVVGGESKFAIECDGDSWHGPEQYDADMYRQKILERCGWCFYRIRASMFYLNQEESLTGLWSLLESKGINPGNHKSDTPNAHQDEQKVASGTQKTEQPINLKPADSNYKSNPIEPVNEPGKPSFLKKSLTDALRDDSLFEARAGIKRKYKRWQDQSLPDPRELIIVEVGDNLLDIVKAEGPMHCYRAYLLYANAAGIGRISNEVRARFDMAMKSKISAGKIISEDELSKMHIYETYIRAQETPAILLRTRGERKLEEIPPSEVALLAAFICKENRMYVYNINELIRRVLDYYGLIRRTSNAENYIIDAINRYNVIELYSDKISKQELVDASIL